MARAASMTRPTWKGCGPSQSSGTEVKRGGLGIGNMHGEFSPSERPKSLLASIAARLSRVWGQLRASARTLARALGDARHNWTISRKSVSSAGLLTGPTDTQRTKPVPVSVVSVYSCGVETVYNLTVDGEHEYFANGVLVSNCDALRYSVMAVFENAEPIKKDVVPTYDEWVLNKILNEDKITGGEDPDW